MNQKKCNQCGEVKDFTSFYKSDSGRFGLKSKCKVCYKLKTPRLPFVMPINKICTSCKCLKNINDFDKHKTTRDRKQSICKACCRKRHRDYEIKNKENRREYFKIRARSLPKDKKMKWRLENPEKYKDALDKSDKKRAVEMPDSFVKAILKKCNTPVTSETIELKKQIILIKRFKKQINEKATSTN